MFYPHMLFLQPSCKTKLRVPFPKTIRRPFNFPCILVHRNENGTRGTNDPNDPNKTLAGYTGTLALSRPRDPARERANIPPGWRAHRLPRQGGTGGRLISGSRINRRFYIYRRGKVFKAASASQARDNT